MDRYELGADGLLLSALCVPTWAERGIGNHKDGERVNRERLMEAERLFSEKAKAIGGDSIDLFEELVTTARDFGILEDTAASAFAMRLCDDLHFLAALTQRAFREPTSVSCPFVCSVIRKLVELQIESFRDVARAALESGHEGLVAAAAHALVGMHFDAPTEADVALLWLTTDRTTSGLRRSAFHSLGRLAEAAPVGLRDAIIGRLVTVELPNVETADTVCAALSRLRRFLTRDDAARLLERLVAVPRLDEYWIGEVLEWYSNSHPDLIISFLLARLAEETRRSASDEYGYVATPDQLRRHELAGIHDAPTYATALRQIRDATMSGTNVSQSSIADLFWRIGQLDTETLSVLDEWLHEDGAHVEAVDMLIRRCDKAMALERPIFALHACQLAVAVGPAIGETIAAAFVSNAMPSEWSGMPGEVPPAFTAIAARAREAYTAYRTLTISDLFHRIESSVVSRGRSVLDDY
jgi:hypothetical protein